MRATSAHRQKPTPSSADLSNLTLHYAHYVLTRALADRKLSSADLKRYSESLHEEISKLESRLSELNGAAIIQIQKVPKQVTTEAPKVIRRERKRAERVLTAAGKASHQFQGQYLGYMRQIAKTQRAKFKKLAKTAGREETIAAMKKALGK